MKNSDIRRERPKKKSSMFKKIIIFLVVIFFIAGAGAAAGFFVSVSGKLPDVTANITPNASSRIYDTKGRLITTVHAEENRIPVPISEVPKNLQNAFVAAEDVRFYEHHGVDPRGILRAIWANVVSGNATGQGGSTITQQLARNAFLTQEQTLKRKLLEVVLAFEIESKYTKQQILEMYMNQIYFGQGCYGIQTASRVYFGKDGYYLQDYQENRPLIEKNISCLNDFADSLDKSVDVSFLLVPNAVSVMSDKLPAVTQTDDQLESEKYISSILSDRINLCFPYDQLKDAAKSTQVFYKTDHHWTAEGAKVGFDALMTAMNEDIPQVSYNIETVKDFHGTLYSKAPTDFSAADEMHFYTNPDNSVKVNYVEENKQTDTLFDDSFKTKKDKYSTFMGGNFALTEIETNGESDEHVLIIKDSYANTVMPYFADKYKHITMIDMRYYHIMDKTVSEYVKDNGITKVIFLYNMDFVNTDNNFIWLE